MERDSNHSKNLTCRAGCESYQCTSHGETHDVRMVKSLEDLHLAPHTALIALDLLLGNHLERDLDGETLFVRVMAALGGLGETREVG